MVAALKEAKLWYRDTDSVSSERKTSQRQTEAVYYQRDFINKWLENGWIRKDDLTGRYVVTYAGRNITSTFYTLE